MTFAASAQADHGPPVSDTRLTFALQVAEYRWGHIPCAHVAIARSPYATEDADGWAEEPGCRIWITPEWWALNPHQLWVCALVVHEYGHLAGHSHSTVPTDAMYPRAFPGDECFPAQPKPKKRRRWKRRRS